MATRTRYSVVKLERPLDADDLARHARDLPRGDFPGTTRWSDWTYIVKPTKLSVLICKNAVVMADDAWFFAKELARFLDAPHLELRVQESSHWDFTLFRGNDVIADFSTNVAYFDADESTPRPWKQGNANVFATTWGLSLESVTPYLIDWDAQPGGGYSVEGDRFKIGDWCQIFDFMRVLEIDNPYESPKTFDLEVNMWQWGYARQPIWRRIVRTLSKWTRGAYPDLLPPTPEERAEWKRLARSVQIVRVSSSIASKD